MLRWPAFAPNSRAHHTWRENIGSQVHWLSHLDPRRLPYGRWIPPTIVQDIGTATSAPCAVLAPAPSRKTWAIYGSFKEFHTHLQSTSSWITLCVIRSSQMNTVAANMSQLMKALVHQIISTGQTGIQLLEPKGMPQPMPYKHLYMKIGFWIMDGAAHKFCFSIKGDSGSRFCNLCKNVFVAKTNQDEEEDMEIMEVSSFTKVNQLDLATDTEIWSSWSRMTARKSTKKCQCFQKMGTGHRNHIQQPCYFGRP